MRQSPMNKGICKPTPPKVISILSSTTASKIWLSRYLYSSRMPLQSTHCAVVLSRSSAIQYFKCMDYKYPELALAMDRRIQQKNHHFQYNCTICKNMRFFCYACILDKKSQLYSTFEQYRNKELLVIDKVIRVGRQSLA